VREGLWNSGRGKQKAHWRADEWEHRTLMLPILYGRAGNKEGGTFRGTTKRREKKKK